MHIHVNGKNIEITDAIKAYVKEKLGKVANHYDQITAIDVILTVIKNPSAKGRYIAEVSCKLNGKNIHVEVAEDESMYASIDLVADKLDRQVKKFKDKSLSSGKGSIRNVAEAKDEDEELETEEV